MIQNELHTAFRFYDSLDKQNRFKSQCAAICEFKLLSPLSRLLPFQFNTGTSNVSVEVWRLMCAADDTDMGGIPINLLDVVSFDTDYVVFNGLDPESEFSYIPECGSYYFQVETNQGIFYSEVFQAEDFNDVTFSQSQLPIFTAWRFYDNINKQNKFKSQCTAICDFQLITERDKLLPFMFRIPEGVTTPQSWVIRNEDGCTEILDHTLIQKYNASNGYDYFYYTGESSPMPLTSLTLPNGDFSTSESWEWIDETSVGFEWDINLNRARFRATALDIGDATFSNQNALDGYLQIVSGNVYVITYTVISITGSGFVNIVIGGTSGEKRYAAGTFTETLIASEDGYVQLYASKYSPEGTSTILVDNITISEALPLPCGPFESVVTTDEAEFFSEWINIIAEPGQTSDSDYLLQEDGFLILQENGFGILLE